MPSLVVSGNITHHDTYTVLSGEVDIYPINVMSIRNGRFKILSTENDLKNITETTNRDKLVKAELKPNLTSDLVCDRTLLIRGLDEVEYRESDQNLKLIIETKNKVKVEKIIRIPERKRII